MQNGESILPRILFPIENTNCPGISGVELCLVDFQTVINRCLRSAIHNGLDIRDIRPQDLAEQKLLFKTISLLFGLDDFIQQLQWNSLPFGMPAAILKNKRHSPPWALIAD
jgi:hypothetical protein